MRIASGIAGFWSGLAARERLIVGLAIALVLGAALYLALWAPGMAARQSLSAALPRLRAQVEDMRWQREQVLALRKQVGTATQVSDLGAVLRASAAQASFAQAIERVEVLPGSKARVVGGPLPFDAWLAWAGGLHRELGVRIDTCRISALDEPGQVRIEASFSSGSAR